MISKIYSKYVAVCDICGNTPYDRENLHERFLDAVQEAREAGWHTRRTTRVDKETGERHYQHYCTECIELMEE